jgi:hypothetical protein
LIRIKRYGRETYFFNEFNGLHAACGFLGRIRSGFVLKAPIKSAQALGADIAHQVVFIQYLA